MPWGGKSGWVGGSGELGRGFTGSQALYSPLIKLSLSSEPQAPQSLEVTSRGSPSDLAIGWAPVPGQQEGYRVTWQQEGSQRSLGSLVDLGPDSSNLTLRSLVPGSCYTVSVWTWAGNLSSSVLRARACTREFPGVGAQLPLLSALLCAQSGFGGSHAHPRRGETFCESVCKRFPPPTIGSASHPAAAWYHCFVWAGRQNLQRMQFLDSEDPAASPRRCPPPAQTHHAARHWPAPRHHRAQPEPPAPKCSVQRAGALGKWR